MASTSVTFDILARDRASSTFKNVGDSASKSTSHIAKFGAVLKKAAVGAGLLTAAAAAFTFKVGSEYVNSLNQIQALTGATDKQMKAAATTLEKNAGLYAKMGQTTGDAASGVVELTKSGLSLDDALKSVYGTMTLAKAGALSVADASSVTANALNTFRLKASAAGKVANYLANAANISSADVSDLAESLKYVAPVAASAGVSIKQTNAVLAELANAGIKGSSAGTSFRTFLLSLQAPAAAASAVLKDLGINVYDSTGKMKPLGDVIDEVGGKLDGLSQKEKNADLKAIFGKVGIAGATQILNAGKEGLDKYTKGVGRAGAATKLAESKSKGLAGSFDIMRASAISGAQSIYRKFSPILDKVVRPLATGFANFASGLGPKLSKGLDKVSGVLGKFDIKGIGQDLAKQAKTWAVPVIDGFKKGLDHGDWSGLGKALGSGIFKAISAIGSVADKIGEALGKVDWVGLGLKVGQEAVPFFIGFAAGLLAFDVGSTFKGIMDHWSEILLGVLALALPGETVATKIGELLIKIPFAGKLLSWGFLALNKFSRKMVGKVFDAFKFIGRAFLEAMRKEFPKVGNAFTRQLDVLPLRLKIIAGDVKKKAVEMMKNLGLAIGHGIGTVVGKILQLIRGMLKPWADSGRWLTRYGVEVLGGLIRGIASKVGDVLSPMRALGGKIKSAVGDLSGVLVDAGRAVIEGLWSGISSKLSWLGSKLGGVGGFIKSHKGPIDKDRELLRPAGRAIMEGLMAGIADRQLALKTALNEVTKLVSNLGNQISHAMDQISNLQSTRAGFLHTFTGDSVFGQDLSTTTQDAEGNDIVHKATAADLIAFQVKQAKQAKRLAHDVRKVTKEGLSKALVRQLQSEGTAGAATLHALAQGSRDDIRRLNRLNKQTSNSLRAAGLRAGNYVRGGSIDADIRHAVKQEHILERQEHTLQRLEHHLKEIAHNQKKDQTIVVNIDSEAFIRAVVRRNKRKGVKSAGV